MGDSDGLDIGHGCGVQVRAGRGGESVGVVERGCGVGQPDGGELVGRRDGVWSRFCESRDERGRQRDSERGGSGREQAEQRGARRMDGGRGDRVGVGLAGDVQAGGAGGGEFMAVFNFGFYYWGDKNFFFFI